VKAGQPQEAENVRKMLRILIIDNNLTFRQSLLEMLTRHFPEMDIRTIKGSSKFRDLLQQVEQIDPDIIFADMYTFSDHALGFVRAMKRRFPDRTLVMMCSFDIPEYREALHHNGADFCLLKEELTFEGIVGLIADGQR